MAKKKYMVSMCSEQLNKAVRFSWVFAAYVLLAFFIAIFKVFIEGDNNYPNFDYLADALMAWIAVSMPYAFTRYTQAIYSMRRILKSLDDVVDK